MPVLEQIADQTSLCVGCPKMCRHVCPVSNIELRETVTPGAKMSTVDLVRRGVLPVDEEAAHAVHACTGCGACSQFCLLGNKVAKSLFAAREPMAKAGVSAVARRVEAAVQKHGNPSGADLVALHRERVPRRAEKGPLAYWAGCTALKRLPEHAQDTLMAAEKSLGHEIAVVPMNADAACCGYPLWAAGLRDKFRENAGKVAAHLKGRGTLVTSDPGCAWAFNVLYPLMGAALEAPVKHVSQVLADAPGLPVTTGAPRSLYHDPCYLGRHLGVLDAPRQVLTRATGDAPAEFVWNRERAECCGAGGLYPMSEPEHALNAARRRVRNETDELARTGAARVVTACPGCELQFGRAGVPVMDLSRAVLGASSPAPRSEGKR
jgi:Fe-S oxidoreductase